MNKKWKIAAALLVILFVTGAAVGTTTLLKGKPFKWKSHKVEMSIKNCTIFPIYLCTVFSVYFFNLDSADAVLYEFPKILTILE